VLCGLDRPTSGRVLVDGAAPEHGGEWAYIRAKRIGFVFQAFHLLPTLSAVENVQVPMIGVERKAQTRFRRAAALLDRVGLASRAHHRPAELSGGECQRVAIARSLANGPDVILADEPTGNLDSATSAAILGLLAEIHARDGVTLVIATHDAAISAYAARTIHMLDGRLPAASLREASGPCA
jgi:putative ABC transport system ATP-binding protein